MIAHGYREICSVLMNEYSSNSREVQRDRLNEFVVEFRRLGVSFETPGSTPEPDTAITPVPHAFLRAASAVVRTHTATETARQRARAVIEALSGRRPTEPDVGPTADRWFTMSRSFVRLAHDRSAPDAELMEGLLKQEAEYFEESLLAFAQSAVGNLDALDEILEEANG